MSKEPQMPLVIRIWLALSMVFAPLIHLLARRMHVKQGICIDRFPERLGIATVPRRNGRWIWIHAASLGEVGQIGQLVTDLQASHAVNVIVTTVTESGADWVAQSLPNAVHQYLPVDTPKSVSLFLHNWSPEIAIFIEADIWPHLVLKAVGYKIPLVLLNARPSKSRNRAPKSYHYLLSNFQMITCKSSDVMDGFLNLGISQDKLFCFGDLRATVPALEVNPLALVGLQALFADRPVWLAASSHADDEAEIITACQYVLDHHPTALLIWAPRHPKRAQNILDAALGFNVHQRTKSQPIAKHTQIYLADTLGEMGTFFSCSKIVFLGGSFGDEGGHNPFEPACFGCYILTGPHTQNHRDAVADFTRIGAAAIVSDGMDLGSHLTRTITSGAADHNGEKGRALGAAANGAVEKTVAVLATYLLT